jgi:hypothetical protein
MLTTDAIRITQRDYPEVVALAKRAFPDYRGRTFKLRVDPRPNRLTDTYWDGGSRSRYVFIRIDDGRIYHLPDFISGGFLPTADAALRTLDSVPMVPNVALVRHAVFCGKDCGLTVTLHPDNLPRQLADERLSLR